MAVTKEGQSAPDAKPVKGKTIVELREDGKLWTQIVSERNNQKTIEIKVEDTELRKRIMEYYKKGQVQDGNGKFTLEDGHEKKYKLGTDNNLADGKPNATVQVLSALALSGKSGVRIK